MKRQLLKLSLAICVALLAGCAKTPQTTLVPFASDRSGIEYRMTGKTVYVVLKTGEIHEMRDFTITGDSLAGTSILRSDRGKVIERRTSKIALNDIATIQAIEIQDYSWLSACLGVPLGLLVAAVFVGLLIAGAAGHM